MNDPKTLQEAIVYFSDSKNCVRYLLWSAAGRDGVVCPTCGRKDASYVAKRRVWQCKTRHPKCQFSVKVGTIFEDSPIPLDKWLMAMWMVANCKNGVSSWEIHRALGVTQKTAWFLLHRIRLAMQDAHLGAKLGGEPFHLFRYLDEQSFRYNNRATSDNPLNDADRFELALSQIVGRRVTYAQLTGNADARQS